MMSIKHLVQCLACIKGSNNNNENRKNIRVFNKSSDTRRHLRRLSAIGVCFRIVMLGEDDVCPELCSRGGDEVT